MLIRTQAQTAGELFRFAREQHPCEMLASYCQFVTGHEGYLVSRGYALEGRQDLGAEDCVTSPVRSLPLIRAHDGSICVEDSKVERQDDPVLRGFGLAYSQVDPACPPSPSFAQQLGLVIVRLALLARAMDEAHGHLKHRVSQGQRLLHHPILKATFSEANAAILDILEQARLAQESGDFPGLAEAHVAINRHFRKVAKLKGGHGYLVGGIHSLEYLGSLMLAVYGSKQARKG